MGSSKAERDIQIVRIEMTGGCKLRGWNECDRKGMKGGGGCWEWGSGSAGKHGAGLTRRQKKLSETAGRRWIPARRWGLQHRCVHTPHNHHSPFPSDCYPDRIKQSVYQQISKKKKLTSELKKIQYFFYRSSNELIS